MNKFWEKFFYLLTFITQGPSFLNPKAYSIMHQKHHAYSDTLKDPHSPHNYSSIWKMMIETYRTYHTTLQSNLIVQDSAVIENFPLWPALDKLSQRKLHTLAWILFFIMIYIYLDFPHWSYLLLPLHFLIGPIQGAMVNWFGHKLGYRNFNLPDQSRNTLPVDLLLMGELYQNNHHQNGKKMNFAHKWFEFDPTYLISKILIKIRIIKPIGRI